MQTELQDALQRATSAAAKEQQATQESQQQVGLPIISQFIILFTDIVCGKPIKVYHKFLFNSDDQYCSQLGIIKWKAKNHDYV